MGSYAALRLGAKYSHRFDGISAHSAFVTIEIQRHLVTQLLAFQPDARDDGSVKYWMLQHLPPIRFDCGIEDKFVGQNRELHYALTVAGIQHTYEEYAGGYPWKYWVERLPSTLLFFADALLLRETSKQRGEASESA